MKVSFLRFGLLLSPLALAACASPKMVDTGQVVITTADALPPPSLMDQGGGVRPHLIGPFDRLSVDVFGLAEASREVRVDASGHISLPLAGSLIVAGKTPEETARLIEASLRAGYVKDPRVSVGVVETVSQTVTVDGEVRVPGLYPVIGDMTLMRAIARAQGTTEYAGAGRVVVFRTVNGQQMAALYDLGAIRLGAYRDPMVYPQDIIVVSESRARRLFPQLLQAGGLIMTPIVAILSRG